MARPVSEHAGLLCKFGIEAVGTDLGSIVMKTGVPAWLGLIAPRTAVAPVRQRSNREDRGAIFLQVKGAASHRLLAVGQRRDCVLDGL